MPKATSMPTRPQWLWMQLLMSSLFAKAVRVQLSSSACAISGCRCICGCDGGNWYGGAGRCCCCGYQPISRGNELCMSVISGLRSLCLLVDEMCLGGGVRVNPHMHSYPHGLGHPLCVCHWLVWVGPVGGIWSGDYWMKCGFGFKSQHLCNLSEPRITPPTPRTSSTHKILTPHLSFFYSF